MTHDTSIAAAKARFADMGEDHSVIPTGLYCYSRMCQTGTQENGAPIFSVTPCPFWARDPDADVQANGYCALLGCGDMDTNGTILLWDSVKECGINDADTEEDDA